MGLRLHFLCHGESEHGREGFFCGSGTDSALSPSGLDTARSFASAYAGYPFQAVCSSPLARARATAAPIAEALRLKTMERDGLRDIAYGQWEGRSAKHVSGEFSREYVRWRMNPAKYPPSGGETAAEVATRGGKVIQELKAAFPAGNVLVVSHETTIRILLCSLLGLNIALYRVRLACPEGSVSQLLSSANGYQLCCLADRRHLHGSQRGAALETAS
jgi:probable phosphoglycerate mutase